MKNAGTVRVRIKSTFLAVATILQQRVESLEVLFVMSVVIIAFSCFLYFFLSSSEIRTFN